MSELNDIRVSESQGGGACPEQHTGTLIDGRRFYLRMRHGAAELHVATVEECDADAERQDARGWGELWGGVAYPPIINPDWDDAAFEEAFVAGEGYPISFWGGELATETVYPDDDGYYLTQEDRDASFGRLLDQIMPHQSVYTTETPEVD